jgi:hypothetical protein
MEFNEYMDFILFFPHVFFIYYFFYFYFYLFYFFAWWVGVVVGGCWWVLLGVVGCCWVLGCGCKLNSKNNNSKS